MKRKNYPPPHEIAIKGFEALVEKLGPSGALQFIRQYETGRGNYTKERATILKRITLKRMQVELLGKK